jgi:hypothetical protein
MEITTKAGTFTLVNEEKVRLVIEGTTDAKGRPLAGLGEEALEKNSDLVLAMYDKMAGYIKGEDGAKVKLGSFYDFKNKRPRTAPEITYIFRVNGEVVEVKEGEKVPLEVQAAKIAGEAKAKRAAKAKK